MFNMLENLPRSSWSLRQVANETIAECHTALETSQRVRPELALSITVHLVYTQREFDTCCHKRKGWLGYTGKEQSTIHNYWH